MAEEKAAPGELSIKAAALWLPSGRERPADGQFSSSETDHIGAVELSVATDVAAPEMAVLAAKSALDASGIDPASIGYVVHAYQYHQGFDVWSPAHYIAQQSGATGGLPINVHQTCNGGALALHLAAMWMTATPEASAALVTTADRFCQPGFDRWATDDEAVFSDSGAAVVLGRRGGDDDLLHLLALELTSDPQWEVQMRGNDEFSPAPLWHSSPVDLKRPNKVFTESGAAARMAKAGVEKLYEGLARSLQQARVAPGDIRFVAIPRLIRHMRENVFKPAINALLEGGPSYLECPTGCLGPGDYLANLADISGALDPGDIGLLIQSGGGFTFSCTIVQAPMASGTARL
jgi:3-oxoacyl-[acyl-carrier-protein] synthase-3